MKYLGPVCAILMFLVGCHTASTGPRADFEFHVLDQIPVVPVQTKDSNCSGLLLRDGTILTCSHVIPRNESEGPIRVTGPWIRYNVTSSGDHLATAWGDRSRHGVPAEFDDWAYIRTEPSLRPELIFGDLISPQQSAAPPRIGETLVVLGYSVEQGEESRFVRYWLPVEVVAPALPREGTVFWLKARPGSMLQRSDCNGSARLASSFKSGFSGAPVLRPQKDGSMEVCAILVAAERATSPSLAVAIPVPSDQQPELAR
jgi:hypothetical protein